LDGAVSHDSDTVLHDVVEDPMAGERPDVRLEARETFYSYCSGLTTVEQQILKEIHFPSDRTVSIMEAILQTSNARRTLVSARNAAIAKSLGLSGAVVGAAWRKIQVVVSEFQSRGSRAVRYQPSDAVTPEMEASNG
jgi:hypothetical protein